MNPRVPAFPLSVPTALTVGRAALRMQSVSASSHSSASGPSGVRRDSVQAPEGSVVGFRAETEALRLIRQAEALGVPWRRVLTREIFAEGMLQRFLGSDLKELPLWRALSIIPNALFHSWRVRDLVDRLAWEASAQGSQQARREIAELIHSLTGPQARRWTEEMARAKHYGFAYHRVLELQAVALAAERSRLSGDECIAEICESTGAVRRDAEWALARLESPNRSHALDDAVAQARQEGFDIPQASTELQAFSRLRRFVLRHRIFGPEGQHRRRPGRPRGSRKAKKNPAPSAGETDTLRIESGRPDGGRG
jgi:hypothetical protein